MTAEQVVVGPGRATTAMTRWISPTRVSPPARRSAARRAMRTAVVTFAAFAAGRWAVGNVTVAVFGTFTGLALTGIADFGGTVRGRAAAGAVTTALGIGLAALGTWVSGEGTLVGCAVMFAVVAAIALAGLLGGYAAAGSNALILFYVVAAGSPAATSAISDRIAGVALGGALSVLAAVLVWPEPAHPQTLPSLGAAVQDLAVRLRRLVGASADHPATSHHAAQGIRVVVDALVDRPAAPTAVQRAELYLLNDVERLEGLVARLERSARPSDSDLDAVRGCADALGRCGELLSRGGSGGFDPDAGRAREPAARFGLVARLAAVTQAVERHAEAALGRASDARSRDAFGAGAPRGGWADLLHGARRFRANFTLRSVHVHDALRLGAGLALASAAVGVFGLQHGFWVAFATLTVIKSNLRATGRSVGEAIAGTLVGFALAAAVIAGLEPATGWYVALLPVVVAAAIYANVAVSFLAGQAGFTLVIIVLFNLLGPAGWRIGVVRLEDVAAGALAGLVIGAFAWPRGASATIGTAVGDLLEAAAGYLVVTARAYVGEPLPESRASRRQLAADASVRAESAFAQYLSEHPPPAGASGWAHWLSTGNRLWYAADLVADTRSGDVEPTGETVDAADRMLADCRALARSLRHDRVPPVNADGSSEPPRRRAGLADWLADLAADATARPAQATSRGRFGR